MIHDARILDKLVNMETCGKTPDLILLKSLTVI